jgi:hypothetical protein
VLYGLTPLFIITIIGVAYRFSVRRTVSSFLKEKLQFWGTGGSLGGQANFDLLFRGSIYIWRLWSKFRDFSHFQIRGYGEHIFPSLPLKRD